MLAFICRLKSLDAIVEGGLVVWRGPREERCFRGDSGMFVSLEGRLKRVVVMRSFNAARQIPVAGSESFIASNQINHAGAPSQRDK
jgi:hypothetical protein